MSARWSASSFNDDQSRAAFRLFHPKGNIVTAEMVARAARRRSTRIADSPHLKLVTIEGAGPDFSFGASIPEHAPGEIDRVLPEMHALVYALAGLSGRDRRRRARPLPRRRIRARARLRLHLRGRIDRRSACRRSRSACSRRRRPRCCRRVSAPRARRAPSSPARHDRPTNGPGRPGRAGFRARRELAADVDRWFDAASPRPIRRRAAARDGGRAVVAASPRPRTSCPSSSGYTWPI